MLVLFKCLESTRAEMAMWCKAVLRLTIDATSISDSEYVFGWPGYGFKPHLQPFLLTYPEADITL